MSTEHDLQLHENIFILTIDNLLSGWPTYLIDFTPEQPGPMKILLCLKKPSKALKQDEAYRSIQKDVKAIPVNLNRIPIGPKLKKRDKFTTPALIKAKILLRTLGVFLIADVNLYFMYIIVALQFHSLHHKSKSIA
ncbi:hypothetical protein BS17DRAFT_769760 [Gyrodon lividus]|nr:hypothetical protein BS17DRAFT_769760 [Gyrodon lividus]